MVYNAVKWKGIGAYLISDFTPRCPLCLKEGKAILSQSHTVSLILLLLKHNQLMKSILLDKIWFNCIIPHSQFVNRDVWLLSLLSSARLPLWVYFCFACKHLVLSLFIPLFCCCCIILLCFIPLNLHYLSLWALDRTKPPASVCFLSPSLYYLILPSPDFLSPSFCISILREMTSLKPQRERLTCWWISQTSSVEVCASVYDKHCILSFCFSRLTSYFGFMLNVIIWKVPCSSVPQCVPLF